MGCGAPDGFSGCASSSSCAVALPWGTTDAELPPPPPPIHPSALLRTQPMKGVVAFSRLEEVGKIITALPGMLHLPH